jgi:hypothetical protein
MGASCSGEPEIKMKDMSYALRASDAVTQYITSPRSQKAQPAQAKPAKPAKPAEPNDPPDAWLFKAVRYSI